MDTRFELLGYHLDIYDARTKKYLGHVAIPTEVNVPERKLGYEGRKLEYIQATGKRATKHVKFKGEYITELVPLCGKIVGDKHKTIQEAHEWRNQFGSNTRIL
tara:strand:- start:18150 stop:18458 length:309 start_codon:yes stop_codon:yes gene_type:complete